MMQSQSRSRPDLRFKAPRQLDRKPGRNQRPSPGGEDNPGVRWQRGHQVHPGGIFTRVGWQMQALSVR